ncbi:hypothetical protein Pve01_69870 [Planomonospora venezuelensis]|uniref:Transposase InsO family protein n=1 Tax=Planomonospora venezuelensis TaxID=1999 RepID=A0A841DB96_PLAVE|nr:transposase InsO family protein [Planomonospora venezuelensis]GIN05329.1 hypothetical protein Pve01_69870 [Planomonospora venezuelensis]
MRIELVTDALRAAATCGSLNGTIFHADHGAQYTSAEFATVCAEPGVRLFMGAAGFKRVTLQDVKRWPQRTRTAWPSSSGSPATTTAGGTPLSAASRPIDYEQQAIDEVLLAA